MSEAARLPGRGSLVPRLLTFVLAFVAFALLVRWAWDVSSLPPLQDLSGLPAALAGVSVGRMVALCAGFLVGSVVAVVPHELGHAVAAKSLRLPVLGMAIGGMTFGRTSRRPGLAGHVKVDLARAPRRSLAARVVAFALGGPAGGLVFAGVLALGAAADALPVAVRLLLGGLVASGVVVQVVSLVPGASRNGDPTDGALALRWAFRSSSQLDRVQHARDAQGYAAEVAPGATGDAELTEEQFERLRDGLVDARPELATVAGHRLLTWLIGSAGLLRAEAGEERAEFVRRVRAIAPEAERYAARPGPPIGERMAAAVTLTHVLIDFYLTDLDGSPTAPGSPELLQIARTAELGWRLRPERQLTRNALALARLLQDRPADARALLLHLADDGQAASERLRADADAIRGLAECELGDVAQAQRLLDSVRRRPEQSAYTDWLEKAIRRRREPSRMPEAAGA